MPSYHDWHDLLGIFLFFAFFLVIPCNAQDKFFWQFSKDPGSTLTQCQTYGIKLDNNSNAPDTFGTPPYYMLAFPSDGVPTRSNIGTDHNNLSWTVNQPIGSSLILFVMDSQGNPGGVPNTVFSVANGNSACLPQSPSVNIQMTTNVSGTIETCQPVEFQISGGKKPYDISIVQTNSNVINNSTLGNKATNFTFTNNVNANAQIIVAVSDANGVWGTSSKLFNAEASTKFSCSGLVSSPNGNSTPSGTPSGSHTSSTNRTAIIITVAVSVSAILLLLALAFFLRRWWRRRSLANRQPGPALVAETWYSPVPLNDQEMGTIAERPATTFYNSQPPSSSSSKLIQSQAPSVGSSSYPSTSGSRAHSVSGWEASSSSGLTSSDNGRVDSMGAKPRLPPGASAEWTVQNDVAVIQHQDSGPAEVQEIPPPYNFDTATSSKHA